MAQIYISVGSNIDKAVNIETGIQALADVFQNLLLSPVFESESVGFDGDSFYNLVVKADTRLSLADTVATLKQIEIDHGRVDFSKVKSPRLLDLDLLLYDDVIAQSPAVIPREEITENAYVLWPLAILAPELIHPQLGISIKRLWQNYDKAKQSLWQVAFKPRITIKTNVQLAGTHQE